MRLSKLAPLLPLALAAACVVVVLMPNSPFAPRASAPDQIKSVLQTFTQAMYDADEKTVFECFYIANDQDQQEAQAYAEDMLNRVRIQRALDAAFAPPATTTAPAHAAIPGELAQRIATAQIVISGESAEATMGNSKIFLIRKDKVWKIDFNKTQRAQRGPYDKEKVAEMSARSKIVKEIIAEIQAHKFETRAQATEALETRVPPIRPATSPATANAADADARARETLINIRQAIVNFEVDNGRYPTTAEGLAALLKAPDAAKATWRGPYLDKLPADPWGHPYLYRFPGTDDTTDFDLRSTGPDGKENTPDDITKQDAAT
jgi:type II secretion system protein G